MVDIEARIDDIRQQLRKSDLSKVKAEARLKAMKKGTLLFYNMPTVLINSNHCDYRRDAS